MSNNREAAINLILDTLGPEDLLVACNGKISRELFELRIKRGEPNEDFITIGAMGTALALSTALAMNTDQKVVCLIGDGNFLMGLGSYATFIRHQPRNLCVYVLDNNAHASTGGQETSFKHVKDLFPIRYNFRIIPVGKECRPDLGRPTDSPAEITTKFRAKICRNISLNESLLTQPLNTQTA